MTIRATVIADSVSSAGKRLTTWELTYPRFIHAELLTHRAFSRNASSSRAIPTKRLLGRILDDMALPTHWGVNQPGMQASNELRGFRRVLAQGVWKAAGYVSYGFARVLAALGLHKQVANRIVEPWSHITVIVSTTDTGNFFRQRIHEAAQPEMCELATAMSASLTESTPELLALGEWHLPYVHHGEREEHKLHTLRLLSAARCARVSYLTHDGRHDVKADLGLAGRLLRAVPPHASPFEHQATPSSATNVKGNFSGWLQFRQVLEEGIMVND